MSEPEKIKEIPKPPQQQEQQKEPSTPKVSQSAFDKALEQARVMQQNPLMQGKVAEREASEQRVKEVFQKGERDADSRKKDDSSDSTRAEKARQKDKGSETVTREAVGRATFKKDQGGGGQGRGSGGRGDGLSKKQELLVIKKLADLKGGFARIGESTFAGKLARAAKFALTPQQVQNLVNQIVQSIRIGKNEIGDAELNLILRDHIFKGLRLRFTSKHGKVAIQFTTASRDVKDLFTAESAKIKNALEEKGVAVSDIKVF